MKYSKEILGKKSDRLAPNKSLKFESQGGKSKPQAGHKKTEMHSSSKVTGKESMKLHR